MCPETKRGRNRFLPCSRLSAPARARVYLAPCTRTELLKNRPAQAHRGFEKSPCTGAQSFLKNTVHTVHRVCEKDRAHHAHRYSFEAGEPVFVQGVQGVQG